MNFEASDLLPHLHWQRLRKHVPESPDHLGIRSVALEVDTGYGPVRLGLGDGDEPRLLLPIRTTDRFPKVPEGPVVTAQAAQAMAEGARRVLKADVGLATTGVAGPAEQEGQPVGTVFLGLAMDGESDAQQVKLPGDRQRIRQYAVISAFDLLRRRLMR